MQYWVRKGRTVWVNRRSTFELEDCVADFTDIVVDGRIAITPRVKNSSRVRVLRGMVLRHAGALRIDVKRIQGPAGNHEETVALWAAEA